MSDGNLIMEKYRVALAFSPQYLETSEQTGQYYLPCVANCILTAHQLSRGKLRDTHSKSIRDDPLYPVFVPVYPFLHLWVVDHPV